MISKGLVKTGAEELNIPFKNLLSGAVCEEIVASIATGSYSGDLFLCNSKDFCPEVYKEFSINNIYYEYDTDLDEKMMVLYLRDVLKEIISRSSQWGYEVKGTVEGTVMKIFVTVDDMYIPITVYFTKRTNRQDSGEIISFSMIMTGDEIKLLTSPKEEQLIHHLVEIIEKLELLNDMDHYFEAYEILTKLPLNGRKIKERLEESLNEKEIEISDKRIKALESYRDYHYMKKKWKVELRQKKTSSPSWQDVVDCLLKFLGPIWESMETGHVFLGDWMPQIKRFLD